MTKTRLDFQLHAAAVIAPGVGSLAQLRAIQASEVAYVPAPLQLPSPHMLPAPERRRASQAVRLALACVSQVLESSAFAADTLRSVFATDEGTGEVCQQMLETLATTRQVSPLLFANSVLNAPSGYFSIGLKNRRPSTVVSLGLESFASGLLCAVTEALATNEPVLLVASDPPMTAPMNELLPVSEATATAWIVCSPSTNDVPMLASFSLSLESGAATTASPLPGWMPDHWRSHSNVRGIAALALLDAEPAATFNLPLGQQMLTLQRTEGGAA